ILLGSEPDSYLGKYLPSYYKGNSIESIHQQNQSQQYEITCDKTIVPDLSNIPPYGAANSSNSHMSYTNASVNIHDKTVTDDLEDNIIQQPILQYKEKVQSLHAYKANPEDPNELSFNKGEVLEIAERNGNWWQARKADGTVGIIPSNYVSY
ncbi:uncharacterized protein BX663DRAFT_444591, partial [Cokeromyces recurvatus]|uniref:uncharacterized protein n=1 Tax=Cokeromyces recurvatus TaxID=90255 RepID=UPI00221FA1C9